LFANFGYLFIVVLNNFFTHIASFFEQSKG